MIVASLSVKFLIFRCFCPYRTIRMMKIRTICLHGRCQPSSPPFNHPTSLHRNAPHRQKHHQKRLHDRLPPPRRSNSVESSQMRWPSSWRHSQTTSKRSTQPWGIAPAFVWTLSWPCILPWSPKIAFFSFKSSMASWTTIIWLVTRTVLW